MIGLNKSIKMGMACNTDGEKRNACRTLVGKQYGNRSLERPKCKWLNINKYIYIKYIKCISQRERELGGMYWIDLGQDKDKRRSLENTVMGLRAPRINWKFLISCTTGSFTRRSQLREVI
jgi:hypothetical protein